MSAKLPVAKLSGIWSAAPTPFTARMQVDVPAVKRMVEHHVCMGVNGLFLAGTCGEGPWLTDAQQEQVVRAAAKFSRGRLLLAAQVTDNSAPRILDNVARMKQAGADIAVIAAPRFLINATPENLAALYLEAIRGCPLPVAIYHRGRHDAVAVPASVLSQVLLERNVVFFKDSSMDPANMKAALAARKRRPALRLLNGDEFNCVRYLEAGYDGLLLGGAILGGRCAAQMLTAVRAGDIARANRWQQRMTRLLSDVYGGLKAPCWLAGLKQALVEMGIFSTNRNLLNYSLTPKCRRAIRSALKRDADVLFP